MTSPSPSSSSAAITKTTVNSDLRREREGASFDAELVTRALDGCGDRTERRRRFQDAIERDPTGVFGNDDNAYLHRTRRHVRSLAKHVRLVELARRLGLGRSTGGELVLDPDWPLLVSCLGDDLPTSLHWIMFVPNILSLADDEQQRLWLPLCRDWRMIGCYAQTELGHGSNVRALETTATFLPESRGGDPGGSFVVNSPTLTSGKFWPGTLGRTANYAMVIARLIDGSGVDRGIHNFLVPLRCPRTHELLPGVVTGDVGPKIGYNAMDNGFAYFNEVKIPRRNMAMRFASVDERGRYSKNNNNNNNNADGDGNGASEKVAYITMMQVRAHICNEAGKNLAMATTIAVRYSAVRRQGYDADDVAGANNNNKGNNKRNLPNSSSPPPPPRELQILDYKQQQHRLFSHLAESYCFFFTGKKVLERLREIERDLVAPPSSGRRSGRESRNSNPVLTKAVMQDIHASTSALKSFTTMVAADGMEDCRKACGGHGFLVCSGLPELVQTYLQNPTVEGDNHMLPQQVVKVLVKVVQAVRKGSDMNEYRTCDSYLLLPSLQSIASSGTQERCAARSESDLLDLPTLLLAFRHRAARLLAEVATQLHEDGGRKTQQQAWNDALVLMARVSRAYSQFLLLANFVEGIRHEENRGGGTIGPREAAVLRDLARLFGLYWMERELGDFLEDGYLCPKQSRWVHACVIRQLDAIRPNAVGLVDAWDFSDFRLKSALGRYDGDVYKAIMAAARRDPLNQQDPGPGYEEHLKRLIVDGVGAYTPSRL